MKTPLITDNQSLVSAAFVHYEGANPIAIPVYDDGFGPLFIHRDSMGVSGIVRAQTWEDAYSICEDEFFPAADLDARKEQERIDELPPGKEKDHSQDCWEEAYGYRGNSRRESDGTLSSIYAKDLNGDSLDLLTPELMEALCIVLEIENED
jgi:hypothetical protein